MGAGSLIAEQEASEVTGNNLANVNNPAYSREKVVLQSSIPQETPIGEEGTGVVATNIAQYRSAFIDSQVAAETSVTSSYTSQQSTLQVAEGYLDENLTSSSAGSSSANSPNGITANLTSLFSSFSALAGGVSSETGPNAQAAVAAAQNLVNKFHSISSGLATVQQGTNQSVQSDVSSANQDLANIAALNKQIAVANASGESADTLVDERQAAIQDLGSYTNFTQSTEANGSVDISIGGVAMVSGYTTPDQLQTYTGANGNTMVQAQNAGTQLTISGGSIGGTIAARDGALANLQSGIDSVASNLITQINTVYQASTGQNFFTGNSAATIGLDPSVTSTSVLTAVKADGKLASNLNGVSTAPITALGGQTLIQSYTGTVTALGTAITSATDQLNYSESTAQMLANQQQSVSGVSTDEEMTNLIEYQKAYEASAELVSTVSSMLETVINMGYNT